MIGIIGGSGNVGQWATQALTRFSSAYIKVGEGTRNNLKNWQGHCLITPQWNSGRWISKTFIV